MRQALFGTDLGFSIEPDRGGVTGELAVTPHVVVPGTRRLRAGVLATVVDVVASIQVSHLVEPQTVVTSDLAVHGSGPVDGDRVRFRVEVLRIGSSLTLSEATVVDAGGAPVAFGELTFVRIARPPGMPPLPRLEWPGRAALDTAYAEHLGVRVLAPGVAELPCSPAVVHAAGAMQGGAIAVLADVAASSLGQAVAALSVRYLSSVRAGSALARSTVVAPGTVRVRVVEGARLVAVAVCRTTPG